MLFVDTLQLPVSHLYGLSTIAKVNGDIDLVEYTPDSFLNYLKTNPSIVLDIVPWLKHFHHYTSLEIFSYFLKCLEYKNDIVLHLNSEFDYPIFYFLAERMEFKLYKRFPSGETNYKADGELITKNDRQFIKVTKKKIKLV